MPKKPIHTRGGAAKKSRKLFKAIPPGVKISFLLILLALFERCIIAGMFDEYLHAILGSQ